MTKEDIQNKIVQVLKKIAPDTEPEKLKPSDNIRQVLGIDSFDYLSFIVALDEQLGVQTPEEDYSKISSLETLINYILNKRKAG